MDAPPSSRTDPPPRWLLAATGVLVLGGASWLMLTLYTSPEVRECERRYAAARTAADTALVDAVIPGDPAERSVEAHSCGFMRRSARWR